MMMHFWRGGIGHKAVCAATDYFLDDRDALDNTEEQGLEEANRKSEEEKPRDDENDAHEITDNEMDNENGLLAIAMAGDSDIEDEEFDYGYMDDRKDSDWEGTEEEDDETIGLENSDDSDNIGCLEADDLTIFCKMVIECCRLSVC